MKKLIVLLLTVLLGVQTLPVQAETPKTGVFFENLSDGQKVTSPVKVKMGVAGKVIAPAGQIEATSGHHHIVVDGSFIKEGEIIPADATHLHFGKGQTETEVVLTPGKHTLTLQLANGVHQSYGEQWSKTITVIVE